MLNPVMLTNEDFEVKNLQSFSKTCRNNSNLNKTQINPKKMTKYKSSLGDSMKIAEAKIDLSNHIRESMIEVQN